MLTSAQSFPIHDDNNIGAKKMPIIIEIHGSYPSAEYGALKKSLIGDLERCLPPEMHPEITISESENRPALLVEYNKVRRFVRIIRPAPIGDLENKNHDLLCEIILRHVDLQVVFGFFFKKKS